MPVVGWENSYYVSNLGRVFSLKNSIVRKPVPNKQNGYLTVILHDGKRRKTATVHRLVAEAWCERPPGFDFVNHKNEDKHDNRADNLEWCTKYYNNTYNGKTQRCCKAVEQLDENFNLIKVWKSAREACSTLGIEYKNISTVCRGFRQRAGGYRWRFVNG